MLHIGPGQYRCPSHGPWTYEVLPPQEHRGRAQVDDLTQPKAKAPGGGSKAGRRRKRRPKKTVPAPLDTETRDWARTLRVPRECACGCGEEFTPRQWRQRYASPTHRRRAEARRRRDRSEARRKPEEGA